ncbi:efflux RND transporter periplasmic adaptor subunit [Nitrosococcus watsonii]|uniref:Efflux transporter, RND family, MFP subunit n=1 Tax=Nitrosococcus watsoni (strain C-113) TaxID=105559 RepID=D8K4C6_NITWC|nr:efflux RND transporter periplasmic adaptor subunit [Nitrosococcus watsonii]ADJ27823.1 efflux transporter, RND family, MFP subunit [Nitrosococcus watsonii C-113]
MEALDKLKIHRTPQKKSSPATKVRHKGWLLFIALLAGIAVIYLAFPGVFNSRTEVAIGTVSLSYPAQEYTLFNATGYVVPQTKADIASKATGRLEVLEVEEGNHVKKGDIIARLENQDVLASKEQAQANVAVARAGLLEAQAELKDATLALKRAKALVDKKFINRETYDTAVARHDKASAAVQSAKANILAAQARYQEAKVAVEYTLIRAPFDGVILEKYADLGDVVAPFSSTIESKGAVASMADMRTLQVEADVSESNLMQVKVNQPCEIQLDALPGERFRGRVHMIVPTVDRTKATILVKVSFVDLDDRILPDMSARVAFLSKPLSPREQKPYIVVPSSAIIREEGQAYAFRVNDNEIAHKIPVTLEKQLDKKRVIVAQGLQQGDKVVLNPSADLPEGAQVAPKGDS